MMMVLTNDMAMKKERSKIQAVKLSEHTDRLDAKYIRESQWFKKNIVINVELKRRGGRVSIALNFQLN